MAIKVYIACLASYNAGHLFGKWLDLNAYSDGDDLREAIEEEILKDPKNPCAAENPEEWAMHDIEGISYEKIGRTEYPDLDELVEMNNLLTDDDGEAILGVKEHMGFDSIAEARKYHEENFMGEFKSDTEFADHIAEECNGWDLSEGMGRYFDSEAFARDLMFEHFEIDGKYYRSA